MELPKRGLEGSLIAWTYWTSAAWLFSFRTTATCSVVEAGRGPSGVAFASTLPSPCVAVGTQIWAKHESDRAHPQTRAVRKAGEWNRHATRIWNMLGSSWVRARAPRMPNE